MERNRKSRLLRKHNTLFYVADRFVLYVGALTKKYTWELSNFSQPELEFKQLSALFTGYASILFRILMLLLSLFSIWELLNKNDWRGVRGRGNLSKSRSHTRFFLVPLTSGLLIGTIFSLDRESLHTL